MNTFKMTCRTPDGSVMHSRCVLTRVFSLVTTGGSSLIGATGSFFCLVSGCIGADDASVKISDYVKDEKAEYVRFERGKFKKRSYDVIR